jgi:hypothetical protein
MSPYAAHAQAALFTGSLSCGASDGHAIPAGSDPIRITINGYSATYTHLMNSAGPAFAGLQDFGRGDVTGMDMDMQGGGQAHGITLRTNMTATRRGRFADVRATQVLTGPGLPGPQTRHCQGSTLLVFG